MKLTEQQQNEERGITTNEATGTTTTDKSIEITLTDKVTRSNYNCSSYQSNNNRWSNKKSSKQMKQQEQQQIKAI